MTRADMGYFRQVPLGPCAIPQLPASCGYRVSDVLLALYSGSGLKGMEADRLKRYAAGRSELRGSELRCRLLAFLAGAAAADTVALVAAKRSSAVSARVEATVAKNPRMPEHRQVALRAEASQEADAILEEVGRLRDDEAFQAVAARLPRWVGSPEAFGTALGECDDDDPAEAMQRGHAGQVSLEQWAPEWLAGAGPEDGGRLSLEAHYNLMLASGQGTALPSGIKAEIDGIFLEPAAGARNEDVPLQVISAVAEAKSGCTSLYEDVPRMDRLLEYVGDCEARGLHVALASRAALQATKKGQVPTSALRVRLPQGGMTAVPVHYVLGGEVSSVDELVERAALSAESGKLLRVLCTSGLKSHAKQPVELGQALRLGAAKSGRVEALLPSWALSAAQQRVDAFAHEIYGRVRAGLLCFWTRQGGA